MECVEEVLNPANVCESADVLVSLKLNSQLQSLLESNGGASNLEIEFVSLSEAKIYSGSSVFSLKFSDSASLVSASPPCRLSDFRSFLFISNYSFSLGNIPQNYK